MNGFSQFDVVLLPTFIQVEEWRKRQARTGSAGLLGPVVSTFDAWVADLWELYGDGRALVDSTRRAMAMRVAFTQVARAPWGNGKHPDPSAAVEPIAMTPGIARLAARCERMAAGVREFDAAVEAADAGQEVAGLHPRELVFLRGIARYRAILRELGLVEAGTACALLARQSEAVFPRPMRVLMEDAAPLGWREERFFAACPNVHVQVNEAPGAAGVGRAPEGVKVGFSFPAGRYATPGAVMDLVRDALARGDAEAAAATPDGACGTGGLCDVVITAADPVALYRQIEPALLREGIVGSVQGQVRFGATDFGRACLQAYGLAHDDRWDPSDTADLAASPFSGFTAAQARAFDVELRRDRLARRDAWMQRLCGESAAFARLLALAQEGGWETALDALEQGVREMAGRTPAWRSEQLAAMAGLRLVRRVADAKHAGWRDCASVLEGLAVSVSYAGQLPGAEAAVAPRVLVTSQGAAAQRGVGSCAMLVAGDLVSASYPIADSDDAAATLLGKLGLVPADDALTRARRTFAALLRLPTRDFVCMRPQNDADGNPAYACAMLEEFLDAYREPVGDDPDEGAFGLPRALSGTVADRGEELLYANARAAVSQASQAMTAVPASVPGTLHAQAGVLPARRLPDGGFLEHSPSPSQVELYLECPYKWFVTRRLGAERLEEGFGPLESGGYAHKVLERFYRQRIERGQGKPTEADLPEARRDLLRIADAIQAEMEREVPGTGRYVAANELERRELDQFKGQLSRFLDYEARILPGFRPAFVEYEFDSAHAVPYGGCSMVGTVDRIDVDDAGHAVVVDYKGSVNPAHDIAGKTQVDPGKIQTRIYAQMVKRALGLDVVGALYVSYGRQALAGAADARVLESAYLPGARKDAVWCALAAPPEDAPDAGASGGPASVAFDALPFADMLDATEELVAQAVARMEAGDVAPRPANANVCAYCPAADCPRRGE